MINWHVSNLLDHRLPVVRSHLNVLQKRTELDMMKVEYTLLVDSACAILAVILHGVYSASQKHTLSTCSYHVQ
jgi:hypothetical protein